MNKIIPLTLASLALLSATQAQAWTYNDGDTLLIFRESGFNDVEFNLGNISQFTNLASGTTITAKRSGPSSRKNPTCSPSGNHAGRRSRADALVNRRGASASRR